MTTHFIIIRGIMKYILVMQGVVTTKILAVQDTKEKCIENFWLKYNQYKDRSEESWEHMNNFDGWHTFHVWTVPNTFSWIENSMNDISIEEQIEYTPLRKK